MEIFHLTMETEHKSQQHGPVKGTPAHGKAVGTGVSLRLQPTQTIL